MAEQSYELMHKDDVVASLQLDDLSGAILKVTPGANPELLPLGGSQGADSLRKWWLRRAVPISQGNIAALLQREGMRKGLRLLLSAKKHDVLACEMLDSRFGAVTRWISRVNHKFHDFLAFSS